MKLKRIMMTAFTMFALLAVTVQGVYAKGSSGGRASGGSRAAARPSAPRPSAPKPSAPRPSAPKPSAPRPTTPSKPSVPKVSTRPSTATKTVTAAAPKTVAGKTFSRKGSVVDSTYQPRFSGGYTAPVGSTVYYRDNGLMSWLPFYMIMSNQQHREAVVVSPDGKEEIVKEECTDGMYIFNWIITILLCGGLIAGVVYLINRYSKR